MIDFYAHLGVFALQHLLVQPIQFDSNAVSLLLASVFDDLRSGKHDHLSSDPPILVSRESLPTYRLQNPPTLVTPSDLPHSALDGLVQLFDLLAPFLLGQVGSSSVFP